MLIIVNILLYKDIDSSCYENDGKTLKKVNDTSLDLKISARCEIISSECFKNLKTLQSFSFEENPNLKTIENQGFYQCSNMFNYNISTKDKKYSRLLITSANNCLIINLIMEYMISLNI